MSAGDDAMVFETERLRVRLATVDDVDLFYRLWTDPRVMRYVGFPRGLPITRDELRDRLSRTGESKFDRLLVVELKATGQAIGEAKRCQACITMPERGASVAVPEGRGRSFSRSRTPGPTSTSCERALLLR